MTPLAPLAAPFVARAVRTWVVARLVTAVMIAVAGMSAGAGPLDLAPAAAAGVVLVTVALGLADVARRGERALLGNFGVSRRRLAAWFAASAAAGELALGTLLHGVR